MQSLHRQRGISFWGLLILVPMVGFYLFLGIKLGPEYLSFLSVKSAVDGVAKEASTETLSNREMRLRITKRLDVSSIYFIEKEDIVIKEMEDGLHVKALYNREIPIIGNAYVLLKFEHDAAVNASK